MQPVLVYLTAKDKAEAALLARALLDARLIACANIHAVDSLYRWEGGVQESSECVVIAKSVEAQVARITDVVRGLHSYECPCIVSVPITGGNAAFLEWIARETN